MSTLASAKRNFRFSHTPSDGISLSITPASITFAQGGGQQTATAHVEAYEGDKRLPYNSSGLQVTIFTTPFNALSFASSPSSDGYGCDISFTFNDSAQVNTDIQLTCTVKGVASTKAIHIATAPKGSDGQPGKDGTDGTDGKDGTDGVSVVISPEAIVHKEGAQTTYFVYADMYDGGVQNAPQALSSLGGSEGGNLAAGIKWWYHMGSDRAGYRIVCGATASLPSTLLVPFTVTYNGKTYRSSFSITTVKNGTDGTDGTNGVDGSRGPYIPPAMLWEDYPTSPIYYFESGDPTTDPPETKLDVALVENGDGSLTPYECIQSHYKDSSKKPGTAGGNNYWRVFTTNRFKAIATDLLLADKARIEFLSGQAIRVGDNKGIWGYFGAPYHSDGDNNPGEIIFTGHSDVFQKKVEEEQPVEYSPAYSTFSLNENGYARWGEKSGKRIEVNPDEVAVRIYDKDGSLRTTLSGEWKDPANGKPGGADSAISGGSSVDRHGSSSATHLDAVIQPVDANKASADGSALIKIPQIYIRAEHGGESSSPDSTTGIVPMSQTSVHVTLKIYTSALKESINDTAPKWQRSYMVSASMEGAESRTIPRQDISVPIKKGEYIKVVMKSEAEVTRNLGSWNVRTQESGTAETENYKSRFFSGQFVYKMRQSVISTNGIFISYDSLNYFYVAFDADNKLHAMCVANGVKIFGNDNL